MKKILAWIGIIFFPLLILWSLLGFKVLQLMQNEAPSRSIGTSANGRLENGKILPVYGANFEAYSVFGASFGRTHVHHKVRDAVIDAYRLVHQQYPNRKFVYGETGFPSGGRFWPHRTHRNGLAVDFMVPVLNKKNESVPLPTTVFDKFGYGIEFDKQGRTVEYRIDFDAMAAHLYYLNIAAAKQGLAISQVIFAPELQPYLLQTFFGKKLSDKIPLSPTAAWIRHDEHYHVEFSLINK
jgi:penicillin-insensitive murein endopeptidase